MKIMTEEEYLSSKGASRQNIGDSALHMSNTRFTQKAWQKVVLHQSQKDALLLSKRDALRQEYQELCEKGELRPPTRTEKLIQTAKGHEDNESVQAARRLLDKQGINWK